MLSWQTRRLHLMHLTCRASLSVSLYFSPPLLSPFIFISLFVSPHISLDMFFLSLSICISLAPSRFLSLSISHTCVCISPSASPFNSQEVEEKTPCLFLLALDAHELKVVTGRGGGVPAAVGGGRGGSGGAAAPRLWLLVAWIPDDAKVGALSFMLLYHCAPPVG